MNTQDRSSASSSGPFRACPHLIWQYMVSAPFFSARWRHPPLVAHFFGAASWNKWMSRSRSRFTCSRAEPNNHASLLHLHVFVSRVCIVMLGINYRKEKRV